MITTMKITGALAVLMVLTLGLFGWALWRRRR